MLAVAIEPLSNMYMYMSCSDVNSLLKLECFLGEEIGFFPIEKCCAYFTYSSKTCLMCCRQVFQPLINSIIYHFVFGFIPGNVSIFMRHCLLHPRSVSHLVEKNSNKVTVIFFFFFNSSGWFCRATKCMGDISD